MATTRATEPLQALLMRALRLFLILGAGLGVTIAVGWFSLLDPVKTVDQAAFDALVGALQSIPNIIPIASVVTDLGLEWFDRWFIVVAAVVVGIWRRSLVIPILLICTLFGAIVFQRVIINIVDGTIPVDPRIDGVAGPFFSGGVQRVIVLAGIVATAVQPKTKLSDRSVWTLAFAFGLLEAFTRMALGRHWPFDILAAFPIGFGLIWLYRQAEDALDQYNRRTTNARVPPLPPANAD